MDRENTEEMACSTQQVIYIISLEVGHLEMIDIIQFHMNSYWCPFQRGVIF